MRVLEEKNEMIKKILRPHNELEKVSFIVLQTALNHLIQRNKERGKYKKKEIKKRPRKIHHKVIYSLFLPPFHGFSIWLA